nr:signal peptidase II [Tomitella biformata]
MSASKAKAKDGDGARRPGGLTRAKMLWLIAAVVVIADLVSKVIVVAQLTPGVPVYLIGDHVRLLLVRNAGAAFSMATGLTWILTIVAVCVVIGIIRYGSRLTSAWWALGLGLVLGGALGNLVDRFFRAPGPLQGHVVDFFAVGSFPVFNVADSGITVGAILLVALTLFGVEPMSPQPPAQDPVQAADDKADDQTNDSGTGDENV